MMTMSTTKTNIYVVLLLLAVGLLLSSPSVLSSSSAEACFAGHCNQTGTTKPSCFAGHCNQMNTTNPSCFAGHCNQQGTTTPSCFAGHCNQTGTTRPSCFAGHCNQTGTTNPSCFAGHCNQRGTSNPSCFAGKCCWDATTRGGSCFAGGCNAQAAACDPAYNREDPSSTKSNHKHDKNKSSNYEGGPNSSQEEFGKKKMILGIIVIIIIVVVLLLLLLLLPLAALLWCCCCRRRNTNRNNHRQLYMDENGTVQTEAGRSSWKTYPICYSPVYYYFKGVFGLYGLVSPIVGWLQYTEQCSEWSNALLPQVWFVTVMVLWGLQGLVHVYFILARFVAKHPPSDHLYDGGIEATLKLPLMIGLAMLLVVSILGLNFVHAPASESPACSEVLDDIVKSRAIRYIVLCVLMLLKVGGSNTNRNTHEHEQSGQPATMHYHHSNTNTNTNTNPPAYNPNAFPVNSTAPVMLPLPDAPYQNQNDYGSTKTPASPTVMYSDTIL